MVVCVVAASRTPVPSLAWSPHPPRRASFSPTSSASPFRSNPRSARRTVVPHLSRFRPLALFVRLPLACAVGSSSRRPKTYTNPDACAAANSVVGLPNGHGAPARRRRRAYCHRCEREILSSRPKEVWSTSTRLETAVKLRTVLPTSLASRFDAQYFACHLWLASTG